MIEFSSMKSYLKEVLKKVQEGKLSVEKALDTLKDYPYQDLSFAKVDHHRELRRGFPEIIYGLGKTKEQIIEIAKAILKKENNLLITKIDSDIFEEIKDKLPMLSYNTMAKAAFFKQRKPPSGKGKIVIITAGTSDIPVAEEAFVTCEILGNEVDKIYDVGVAGLHRLFGEQEKMKKARVLIVAAGMEGALPSVVAGMTDVPIIAVPTSVGYGTSMKGLAALLARLNSCRGGVAVVNIDNGFGAGYLASLINHLR
jgi:NCAIR mutase (PurE)-related protein